ncbi:MAG: amidohydrolase family protein [Candidatus Atribacteria bacterium]|nr:amidohydrolase family protein [Candidatus Atribacteria bacterium]
MVRAERTKKRKTSRKKKWFDIVFYTVSTIIIIVLLFIALRQRGLMPLWIDHLPSKQVESIAEEIKDKRDIFNIINGHEHVQNMDCLPLLRQAMKDCQIKKMVLLGTPYFTFFMKPQYGFTGYEENNDFIVELSRNYPDEFAALVTLDPRDANKLEGLKKSIENGADGVKLYNGHGTFYDSFFKTSLVDPGMMEIYAYCEQENIPILYHINSGRFSTEFEHILQEFPELIIVAPHFMLSTNNLTRLDRFMKEYPQLYLDISFGHPDFLVAGFGRISNNYSSFQDFILTYRERIIYGTDLVVTTYQAKNRAYIGDVHLAYMDLLEKKEYILPVSIYNMMTKEARKNIDPNRVYHGLNLDAETLRMIYHDNAERLFFKR